MSAHWVWMGMRRTLICSVVAVATLLASQSPAFANHGFNDGRHWNKTTITFIDSLSSNWDATLQTAVNNSNAGLDEIEIKIVHGKDSAKVRKSCPQEKGKVRLCNFPYDQLSFAQSEAHISATHHFKSVVIKFDEVDLNFPSLPAICHETGHALGLDHRAQNEMNSTCMTPALFYSKPDQHDFDVIDALHAHVV